MTTIVVVSGSMSPARASSPTEEADGRVRRGQRNRAAIVNAIYELILEEQRQPTARQVAERAGVQPRTVFRHFQDMASLNAELSARVGAEVRPRLLDTAYEGTLDERIATVTRVRGEVFDRFAPFQRLSNGLRMRFEPIQDQHEESVAQLRENLRTALPELRRVPAPLAASIELLFSFEAWDRLRADQGLSSAQARRAVQVSAAALFAEGGATD